MEIQFVSGLSTRSPLLSPHALGWRSNRLCVIKWWWWLYLTFVKGGVPDFCRSVLSASIQWINLQTEWDRLKMLFLGVNTRVILRWTEGMCLQRVLCLPCLCLFLALCVRVCVSAYMRSTCSARSLPLPPLTCEVEEDDYIPRGQLYLHGDPRRNTNIRNMLRIPPHYLQLQAREEGGDRQTAGVDAMRCN